MIRASSGSRYNPAHPSQLTLTSGTRLGPYEVVAPLGVGGMGEVYRATDTNLKRQVAIKVLPASLAADAERLTRFQREAEILAALNHSNIAHIHGLERSDGTVALVMELVEGPTLADRIAKGPIPLDEAVPIAKQIADALEAAHDQGIVHRDLKPANIKVRPDGTVKVLDFGLAKAMDPVGAPSANAMNSPTISIHVTQAGIILGTAAYMSPEQARGKAVDKRADIWAFGAVLFEMLSGKPAFPGDDISQVLARVIDRDVDWSALPATAPVGLRRLLSRCLKKDPKARLRDIGDARLDLDEALTSGAAEVSGRFVAGVAPMAAPWRRALHSVVAILIGSALTGTAVWWVMRSTPSAVQRLSIMTPVAAPYVEGELAVSPDGTRVVYPVGAGNQPPLYLRNLDQLEALPLHGTEGASNPFFSPDGEWVGFFSEGKLKKIAVRGGPAVTICDAPGGGSATWGAGDSIAFSTGLLASPNAGLFRVMAAGGRPVPLTVPDAKNNEQSHTWPTFLPDGKAVLFSVMHRGQVTFDEASVEAFSPATGIYRTVIEHGYHAKYVASGHLVYTLGGNLLAVPFDLDRLQATGPPVPVVEGILGTRGGAPIYGNSSFTVSSTGLLVYAPAGPATTQRTLVWVDRQGREEPLAAPPHAYVYPRVSPDGTRVAVIVRDQGSDIWIWNIALQTLTRLTLTGNNSLAAWTPDGTRIAFASTRAAAGVYNLYWQAADGTGQASRLTDSANSQFPYRFSSDGRRLLFQETDRTSVSVHVLSLDGEHQSSALLHATFNQRNAALSPDGRWLAYQSDESGQSEVYVRPFPQIDAGRWQVSTGRGEGPVWARSGRELFFLKLDPVTRLMAVPLQPGTTFSAGNPQQLFEGGYADFLSLNYDVSPDDRRFLMVKARASGESSTTAQLIVVQHWFEDLKRLVPTK